MRHDLILFDLDGTLSDPLEGFHRSLNFALSHFGYRELAPAEVKHYIGPPLDGAFACITGSESKKLITDLVAKYRERYADVGYTENALYPGIEEALRGLRQVGMRLAVCTSKRRDFAEKILEMFGLRAYFEFVDGGEIGIHKWQQLEALRKRACVSEATVMVGDRAVDIIAAHRNGLQAAAVLWGYGSVLELAAQQPRYSFASSSELGSLAAR